MLIIGTMDWASTRDSGGFFCPECGVDRSFRRRACRPFLTVYFIPVIPIGSLSEYIECESCRLQFADDVLELTAADYQQLLAKEEFEHIFGAMILMLLADDLVEEEEIQVVQRICAQTWDRPVSREELLQEVKLARQAQTDLIQYVGSVVDEMTNLCKDQLVRNCFLVATATGELDEQQSAYLERLPPVLGISDERFRSAVEMAVEASE